MKRKIFISYHHKNDQYYCDTFRNTFCNDFETFTDNSLQRALNSDSADYIDRRVREEYIFGTSVTIVLCGQDTRFRKFVDWEIGATLNYRHGLLGIILPTCETYYDGRTFQNYYHLPQRLSDNTSNGYAHIIHWNSNHYEMQNAVEIAISRATMTQADNSRTYLKINGHRSNLYRM